MRKVIIIGNGFDLAHGLKTKYQDFILWYLNKAYYIFKGELPIDPFLPKMEEFYAKPPLYSFDSIPSFFKELRNFNVKLDYPHKFIEQIIENYSISNWVDIESKYYEFLISRYKIIENQVARNNRLEDELIEFHACFEHIKVQLEEYLLTIDNIKTKDDEIAETIKKELDGVLETDVLFLNFNYTSTIEQYTTNLETINYIHGELNNDANPIIFGYGDEMDEYYEKIERKNINEFLNYFKSFGYFKTKNYQNFSRFIDDDPFEVVIMGHSCGLSDRVLLNSVFTHKNCIQIKIYYHQKSATENDYFEKTQEISRHFSAADKGRMRNLIVPKEDSVPLKKFQE